MIAVNCKKCGQLNQHRESSIGTIQQCKRCGTKYKLSFDPPESPAEYQPKSKHNNIPIFGLGLIVLSCGLPLCLIMAFVSSTKTQTTNAAKINTDAPIEIVSLPKKEPNRQVNPIVIDAREKKTTPVKADVPPEPITPKVPEEKKESKKVGDEKVATDLLTQAKFLKGTNQMERCKSILNDILLNHPETKAATEAKKILDMLK